MTPDDRRRAAQSIMAVPFFTELMDELEKAATNQCIHANINDDETRRNAAAEVRAIRSVRQRIGSLAEDKAAVVKQAPA